MPQWARLFVLLVGMLAWLGIVAVSLWLQQIPSAVIVGFPAALWLALSGGDTIARKRASPIRTAEVPKADPTEKEGDRP
jgi:hypothetical protein